jgi:hypothetical protein
MAKRFHSTEVWYDDWFTVLPKDYKMFWFWVNDRCDHAGIFEPSVISFKKNTGCNVDLSKALEYFNFKDERVKELKNGKWFISLFVKLQYGNQLNPSNKVHESVIKSMADNGA